MLLSFKMTWTFCVLLASMLIGYGSTFKMLDFPNLIDPFTGQMRQLKEGWMVNGSVTLEDADNILFQQMVNVFAISPVCSIDLQTCSTEDTHSKSDICYCRKESDHKSNLYVRGGPEPSTENRVVMAGITGQPAFSTDLNTLVVMSPVGQIPADKVKKEEVDHEECPVCPSPLPTPVSKSERMRPHTCADVQSSTPRPVVTLFNGFEVVCDTQTDNGGWIIIQRRARGDIDFYRGWSEYKYGFGDLYGDFWFGLEKIHELTYKGRYELRVDLTYNNTDYYAHYKNFSIYGEAEHYKLQVYGYSGTAGDSLGLHNNYSFSTKDRDNDISPKSSCAKAYHGAWWYEKCHSSNLNGKWGSTDYAKGLDWVTVTTHYDSATFSEMKIRPLNQ